VPAEASRVHDEVEFFGQKEHRRAGLLCGGLFGQYVRPDVPREEQLKQSILNLNSEQAFCIVFFMEGRQVMMSGSGRLELATAAVQIAGPEPDCVHQAGRPDRCGPCPRDGDAAQKH
jgi:hypothetical protein